MIWCLDSFSVSGRSGGEWPGSCLVWCRFLLQWTVAKVHVVCGFILWLVLGHQHVMSSISLSSHVNGFLTHITLMYKWLDMNTHLLLWYMIVAGSFWKKGWLPCYHLWILSLFSNSRSYQKCIIGWRLRFEGKTWK